MIVQELEFKYRIADPSFIEPGEDDVLIAAYPATDIRFAVCIFPYICSYSMVTIRRTWCVKGDIRNSPQMNLVELGELLIDQGHLMSNTCWMAGKLAEFPAVAP